MHRRLSLFSVFTQHLDVQTSNPCRHRSTCAKSPGPLWAPSVQPDKNCGRRLIQILVPNLKAACHSPRIDIDLSFDS
jgi:hypothetical protein